MMDYKFSLCNDRCYGCVHCGTINRTTAPHCVYILDTGHRRPCPAGKKCEVFTPRASKKAVVRPKVSEMYDKICFMCGKVYQGGARKKYCPECAKNRMLDGIKQSRQTKRDVRAEKEMMIDKVCQLCGRIYHSATKRTIYCEGCRKKTK